jgi:enamine deaminase RidA (YjgF/YER057c/UK114 family)
LKSVAKTVVHITTWDDLYPMNDAYTAAYSKYAQGYFPARAVAVIKALPQGARVQIEAFAFSPTGDKPVVLEEANSQDVIQPVGFPYSTGQKVRIGDKYMIFCSGQAGDHPDGSISPDITTQVTQSLENLKSVLR